MKSNSTYIHIVEHAVDHLCPNKDIWIWNLFVWKIEDIYADRY